MTTATVANEGGEMRMRWILVALLLLVSSAWSVSIPENAEHAKKTDKKSEKQQGASTPTTSVNIAPSDNRHTKTDQASNKGGNESPKWTDMVMAVFTALLVIVTAGLICVGEMQRRQLKRTVDAMRDQFNATHRPILKVRKLFVDRSDAPYIVRSADYVEYDQHNIRSAA